MISADVVDKIEKLELKSGDWIVVTVTQPPDMHFAQALSKALPEGVRGVFVERGTTIDQKPAFAAIRNIAERAHFNHVGEPDHFASECPSCRIIAVLDGAA